MPQPGDSLPLSMKLFDTNPSMFVRATVRDDHGNILSTILLSYVGQGRYEDRTLVMPSGVNFVSATYEVFDDALFTSHSNRYTDGTDVFPFEIPSSQILAMLINIQNKLVDLGTGGGSTGQVIMGVLSQVNTVIGMLGENAVKQGTLEQPPMMTGTLEDASLSGRLEQCE